MEPGISKLHQLSVSPGISLRFLCAVMVVVLLLIGFKPVGCVPVCDINPHQPPPLSI